MKNSTALGALLSLSLMMACAPVASSVPKVKAHVVDDRVMGSRDALRTSVGLEPIEIVSADEYQTYEKELSPEYKIIEKFREGDPEFSEILQSRTVKNLIMPANMKRADLRIVLVVKGEKPRRTKVSKLESELFRSVESQEKFTVSISQAEKSDAAWSDVKKNLTLVMIAYRQPITE